MGTEYGGKKWKHMKYQIAYEIIVKVFKYEILEIKFYEIGVKFLKD